MRGTYDFLGGGGGGGDSCANPRNERGVFYSPFFFLVGVMVKMKGPYDFFRWGKGAGAGGGLKYI